MVFNIPAQQYCRPAILQTSTFQFSHTRHVNTMMARKKEEGRRKEGWKASQPFTTRQDGRPLSYPHQHNNIQCTPSAILNCKYYNNEILSYFVIRCKLVLSHQYSNTNILVLSFIVYNIVFSCIIF